MFYILEISEINTLRTENLGGKKNDAFALNMNTITTMDNIETVKKMYEFFATKNNNAIRQIFDENIQWNQMKGFPGGGQYIGADAVFEKVFTGFRENWTDWKATITRYIDSSDGAFVIGFYEGTFNATGKYMKAEFACEYKVKDGKITAFNQYTDTFLIAEAMGLMMLRYRR
jgi:hypothetical protein